MRCRRHEDDPTDHGPARVDRVQLTAYRGTQPAWAFRGSHHACRGVPVVRFDVHLPATGHLQRPHALLGTEAPDRNADDVFAEDLPRCPLTRTLWHTEPKRGNGGPAQLLEDDRP